MRDYVEGQMQNNEDKRSSISVIDQSGSFQGGPGDIFGGRSQLGASVGAP
jgi:hypothetical protein